MSDQKKITIHYEAYCELVRLAWCGVNDGAGRDEDMKRLEKHAERQNPWYKTQEKEIRRQRVEREKLELVEVKAFALAHRHKEMWLVEGLGVVRVKVRIMGVKDRMVQAKVIGPVQALPGGSTWETSTTRRTIGATRPVDHTKLTALDAQFGEPQQVKKTNGAYKPGAGLRAGTIASPEG